MFQVKGHQMTRHVLETARRELIAAGLVQHSTEFCQSWLGKSECYLRTLRIQNIEPSADALSTLASKLRYYADKLERSGDKQHETWARLLRKHQQLSETALEQKARHKWMQPERMGL
jgi:hypothetical protein